MAFSIPNEADASVSSQAAPDSKDIEILVAGQAGTGVVSGCAVTAQGSPDMTLAVAAGIVAVLGAQATVSAGNVTITTAHATNPRFDLVVVNSSGTKSVTAGTAAVAPVFPTIPASSVVLAAVYVPANDAAIGSTQIVDKRVVLVGTPPNSASAAVATSESTASTTYTDLTTSGPAVTVAVPDSGKVWVELFSSFKNTGSFGITFMSVVVSGASTLAVSDDRALADTLGANLEVQRGGGFLITGLTPGSCTFTAKYRVSGGTATYKNRSIKVSAA